MDRVGGNAKVGYPSPSANDIMTALHRQTYFMRLTCAVVLTAASLMVAGCGFKPMYADPDTSSMDPALTDAMAAVRIRPIADHDGVKLRQALREGLQPSGPADRVVYDLDVQMRSVTQELGVRKDATSSRANRVYTARFSLFENGRRIFGDHVQTIVSYTIADDQYATVTSIEDAGERAIKQIGNAIKTRLAIFLRSYKTANATSR